MQNYSDLHGNHNIVIQGVSDSTITLQVDNDQIEKIHNTLTDLKQFLQRQAQPTFQAGEKIYNISEITEANFHTIIKEIKNVIHNSTLNAGRDIRVGDDIHYHYGDRKIKKYLGSRPFQPELFLGRDKDLNNVHQLLFKGENLLLLVNGQGGMGKTTLAARYYFQYHQHYSHLAWVFAEQSLLDALLTLAVPLEIAFPEKLSNTQRLGMLLDAMRELQKPCLLVIDNANRLEDLQQHYLALRSCPNFHLLLTTRITRFENATSYPIGALAESDAIALFKEHYKEHQPQEDPLLRDIIQAVGGNTLLIELLAKNLQHLNELETTYRLDDLLNDLQTNLLRMSKSETVSTAYQAKGTGLRYEKPEVIVLAMYDLTELEAPEQQLLSVFAVLPAENIPFTTLKTLLPAEENLQATLLSLAAKGWIDYQPSHKSFKCSPVIQEITRHKNKEQLLAHCDTMLRSLIDKLDRDIIHEGNYKYAAQHALYAENVVNNLNSFTNNIGIIYERLGNYYNDTGNLDKAMAYYEMSFQCDKDLYEAHPDEPDYKNNLAISYEKLGETQRALGNLEEALRFFEERNRLGKELYEAFPSNLDFKKGLAISYQYLGNTYSSLGKLQEALNSYEKMNIFFQELYESFPSNVGFKNGLAISYEKLGKTQSALGNLEAALRFFEQETQLFEELYEAFPTNVGFKNGLAWSNQFLGITHNSLGDLNKALSFFEEMQQLFEELYEAFPTNVDFKNGLAISYEKLGRTLAATGNLNKVLHFFEEYNRLEKELYESFPQNVNFKLNLGWSFYFLGDYYKNHIQDKVQARVYFQQAEAHWAELSAAFPAYVQFGRFLELVRKILVEL